MQKITDEFVLSAERITARQAADYLGITYAMLTWQMREDALNGTNKAPFGYAVKHEGGNIWRYNIIPKKLYNFKNGISPENNFDIEKYDALVSKLDKAVGMMTQCVKLMTVMVSLNAEQ